MTKSVPIAILIAGLVIGGAEIASAWIQRPHYALGQFSSDAVARMDVHSGRIDICQPAYYSFKKIDGTPFSTLICVNEQGHQIAPTRP